MGRGVRVRRVRTVPVMAAVGVLALASGCSDDGGSEEGAPSRRSFSALLAQLPLESRDGDGVIQIQYGDLVAASSLADVQRPSNLEDDQALFRWLRPLTGFSLEDDEVASVALSLPELLNPNSADRQVEFRDEMGFSVLDVDRFVASDRPPSRLLVIDGDVDSKEVDRVAGPADDGMWTIGEGEDFSVDGQQRSVARPLGQPLHEATHAGLFGVSTSSVSIADWVDGGTSMADDAGFAGVAAALDDCGAYTAFVVSASTDGDAAVNPFDTIGVGMTVADGKPVACFVYHYADGATAERAATTIQEILAGESLQLNASWSEIFASSTVTVDGDVVVATLPLVDGRRAAGIVNILFAQDNLTSRG